MSQIELAQLGEVCWRRDVARLARGNLRDRVSRREGQRDLIGQSAAIEPQFVDRAHERSCAAARSDEKRQLHADRIAEQVDDDGEFRAFAIHANRDASCGTRSVVGDEHLRPTVGGERLLRLDTDQVVEDAPGEEGLQSAGLFDAEFVPARRILVVHAGEDRHRRATARLQPA